MIQNVVRSMYVEEQVGVLLGDRWTHTGADWTGWDLRSRTGHRLEVTQATARQAWAATFPDASHSLWFVPTPVGPVPRDPDDPDLWDEWHDLDEDEPPAAPRAFPLWVRVAAVVLLVGFVLLFVVL